MEYQCKSCGMGVKGLTCSKCDSELVEDTIQKENGSQVQVAKCPQGCGMIKSPQCCAKDMTCAT